MKMLSEQELCKMCIDYSVDCMCEKKESCRLLSIVRDNKRLSKENKEVQNKIKDLKLEMSYMANPNWLGDRNGQMGW